MGVGYLDYLNLISYYRDKYYDWLTLAAIYRLTMIYCEYIVGLFKPDNQIRVCHPREQKPSNVTVLVVF